MSKLAAVVQAVRRPLWTTFSAASARRARIQIGEPGRIHQMGILSRLLGGPAFDVFSASPGGATAARYGRVPVPGEASLELPAALVRIYYEVDGGAGSTFHPPADLVVEVHDAAGVEVPIRKKLGYGRASHRTWGGEGRTYVGRIDVPRAGAYVVTARRTAVGIHENPRVCLGD